MNDILSGNQSTDATTLLPDISSSVNSLLAPFIWFSMFLAVAFIGLYTYSMVRRRRLENALFDIQKNIAEMNARDKARTAPPPPKPRVESNDKDPVIAQVDESSREP